jgi:hypothetical protein
MKNRSWTVSGALSEFIDNSFGAGRGHADAVALSWNHRARIFSILDNGVGMPSLNSLLRFGDTIGRTPGDIGEYGCGGTMALLYLADTVELWSLHKGRISHYRVRWADHYEGTTWPPRARKSKRATEQNTPPDLWALGHGTLITLTLDRRLGRPSESNLKRDLAVTYAPSFRLGRRITWHMDGYEPFDLVDPFPGMVQNRVDMDLSVNVDGHALTARASVGIVPDLPVTRSVVSVCYGGRVISSTKDCYRSPHPDGPTYSGVGVTGHVDLDDSWQGLLATTKDEISDRRAHARLMAAIFSQIEPLLKKMERERHQVFYDNLAFNLGPMFWGPPKPATRGTENTDGTVNADKDTTGKDPNECGTRTGDSTTSKSRYDAADAGPRGLQSLGARITIEERTDKEMGQLLTSADLRRVGQRFEVRVYVNRDHRAIQTARDSKPVNQLALVALINPTLANALVGAPDILARMFPDKALESIRANADPAALVARLLMDRWHGLASVPLPEKHEAAA